MFAFCQRSDWDQKTMTDDPIQGLLDQVQRLSVFEQNVRTEQFRRFRTIGTGTFGRVYVVQHVHTGMTYALKELKKDHVVRQNQVEHCNAERAILAMTRGQNLFLIQMYQCWQDARSLYMLLEYCPGGELFSHLRRAQRFSSDVARFYAAEVVAALQYLHRLDIIYRDLKPENILLDSQGHVKLCDLGFAKRVSDRTYTVCGTPDYLAPEIILNKGYGRSVDWWALGVLIFEMLAGYPPFWCDDTLGIYQKIVKGIIHFPADFDLVARDLVRKLVTADLTRRLGNLRDGAEDIKRHPWMQHVPWQALRHQQAPFVPPPERQPGEGRNFDVYPEEEKPTDTTGAGVHDDKFPDWRLV